MRESGIYEEMLAEGELKGKIELARKIALNLIIIGMAIEKVATI